MQLPFGAQAYASRSLPLLAQQCVNMFVERSPQQAKTQVPVFMCPGLDFFARLGSGPINGMHVMDGSLYAVSGGELFSVATDGQTTAIGQTNLGGIVSSADNGDQIVFVDGNVGWVYQPAGLNQILLDTVSGFTTTNLTATAMSGDTTIQVASIAQFANGDSIGVLLDNGGTFDTTVSGTPTGHTITLAAAMPAQATSGAAVYDYTHGNDQIIVASIGTIQVGQSVSIELDSGVAFVTTIAAVSGPPPELLITLASPVPSQASAGAVVTVAAVVLGQITAPAFMPAATVVYFDDYFIFDARGTNMFFLSALGDGTQYNGLDFASAQADPDYVVAVVNYHEQLWIMGAKTVEVWYDSGSLNFPFQRFDGAFIQRGLASPQATVKEDNTVFWLGEDGIFYRANGFTPVRISQFGMEHAWAQYPTITDASCFVVTMEGHKFIFVNFLSGNATWCYDISSGLEEPLWAERESWGSAWV